MAKDRGLKGFIAEVLTSNIAATMVLKKGVRSLKKHRCNGDYEIEILF
jgi:hypothetical protein